VVGFTEVAGVTAAEAGFEEEVFTAWEVGFEGEEGFTAAGSEDFVDLGASTDFVDLIEDFAVLDFHLPFPARPGAAWTTLRHCLGGTTHPAGIGATT
jgi:hypothetical protein